MIVDQKYLGRSYAEAGNGIGGIKVMGEHSGRLKIELECGETIVLESVPTGPVEISSRLPSGEQPSEGQPASGQSGEQQPGSRPSGTVKRPPRKPPHPGAHVETLLVVPLENAEIAAKLDLSQFPSGSAVELSTQLDDLEAAEDINLDQLVEKATTEIVTPPIGLDELEKIDLGQLPAGSTLLVGARAGTFDPEELFGTLSSIADQYDLYGKGTNVDVRIFRSRD